MREVSPRLSVRALAVSAAVLSVVSTLLSFEVAVVAGRSPSYMEPLLNTGYWTLWAVFAPLIARMAHRFPFERNAWLRPLAVHLPVGLAFAFVHILIMQVVRRSLVTLAGRRLPWSYWASVQQSGILTLDWNMMAYWMIVGAALAVAYREEARVREMAAARLETELVQSRLSALQSQLHPHFLFNALHAISALMHRDVDLAERTLSRLADLLRMTLRDVNRRDVSLREELDFIRNYVEIEQTRFQDRLTVRLDVSEETLGALVPWMLLQPLVENAIKHGVAPYKRPGTVEILARRDGQRLRLVVRDDGPGSGPPDSGPDTNGIGLKTTRARLQHQFGEEHQFEMRRRERGVEVSVTIPWRPAPPPGVGTASAQDPS